ncbi:MAG: hypothetical protein DRG69_07700 [Deltaproteobacteria bacterium]|nr:MAG: hypothetical protein DRG69_07700 [Deltaproteobacteria bacterium]
MKLLKLLFKAELEQKQQKEVVGVKAKNAVPTSFLRKVKSEYAKYGIDENNTVADLHGELINVCYMLATSKNSFIRCLDEGAKMTRRKIQQLRKTVFADRLNEPVDEDVVQELIEELNTVKASDGTGLGDIKQKLIIACANVSKNIDDLLTCVDEGEKIPLIINKDLAKLL